ncbi:sensor histidine kinase [Adhaeribacter rhizoryzae]|uniref:histidine kinase n=1 Tax=Adhaeribacter rhizoryzae TaxID=2607907 RepID=A0A5M6DQ19_9BACT|nr:HAMP domain-containing sensor histidine kinase [Adhaeribacter rhizoryzae]KAA5549564.1 HAMP domain-containing histidine kinase [Adhaeribacter rhizoryzae]
MTIRNRLTFTFTALIAIIIFISGLAVYLLVADFTERDFYNRLADRAILAGQLQLEQDELSAASMAKLKQKSRHTLMSEQVEIYAKEKQAWLARPPQEAALLQKVLPRLKPNEFKNFILNQNQAVAYYYTDNQGDFYILVAANDLSGKRKLGYLQLALLVSFIGSILLVIVVGRLVANQALDPIATIIKQVNTIRATNLHLRLSEGTGKDEIANLSQTFNQMLDRLEHAFASQKNFISNASHELQNPLTAIAGEIEVTLTRDRSPAEYKASLERLQSETERLEKLTKDLLQLAQADQQEAESQYEPFRIDELIWEVLEDVKRQGPCAAVRLILEDLPENADNLIFSGNKALLGTALKNLLENACKFSNQKPVSLNLKADEKEINILIRDEGIGIPAADLRNIAEPFFRARNARGIPGTGVGLNLSTKIIKQHGGTLSIKSEEEQGTEVMITLPIVA